MLAARAAALAVIDFAALCCWLLLVCCACNNHMLHMQLWLVLLPCSTHHCHVLIHAFLLFCCSYNMRNTIRDDKIAGKLDASDKETIESKVKEVIEWLDNNLLAEVEEYEHQQKVRWRQVLVQ